METRRNFLKLAAMLSGMAGMTELIPDSVQRAYAIEPEHGSTYLDAEHIVILMQENRSFDHALGMLQGVRGFNDPRAIRTNNGNSVFVQTDAAGNSYAPWRLDIQDTRITWMGSLPHSRESQVDAWNSGHHDGWVDAKRSGEAEYAHIPITMGHYTREDLPFYYALADAFTVCDQHYCSVLSSTTPNRSYFWTGTIRNEQSADSKAYIRNEEVECGGMTWKTFPERLQKAGIGWKVYQNELTHSSGLGKEEESWLGNYGDNPLEYFAAYNVQAYPGSVAYNRERLATLSRDLREVEQKWAKERDADAKKHLETVREITRSQVDRLKAVLADSGEARYQQLSAEERALHHSALVTNAGDPDYRSVEDLSFRNGEEKQSMAVPKGDVLHQFRKDVNEGTLPTVSWLVASERFSDHPSSAWYGAWYVSETMEILTKNPDVWKKTIFILTYDENDGYFDHAPSYVPADAKRPATGGASVGIDSQLEYTYVEDELRQGVSKHQARTGPIGMGFRVPMIIASPWSRGGWINSQLCDHTSTLMFLEQFLQNKYGKTIREENISSWRRAISGDLTSAFRPYDARVAELNYLARDKFVIGIREARDKEVPSNYSALKSEQIQDINRNAMQSQFMPHQEKGIRPSCALPYELYADGNLNVDGSKFMLTMTAGNGVHGKHTTGAPFNVYLRNTKRKEMQVATYTVKPGDSLQEEFPLMLFAGGNHSIEVHGPNGFYRSFTGDGRPSELHVQAAYERRGALLTGNVQLSVVNTGERPVLIMVEDNSYRTGTVTKSLGGGDKGSVILNLQGSHCWYDFTVKADTGRATARFAGRVETGRSSFSDPLMGGVISA